MDAFQDKWPRWRQLTGVAAHRGVLCFGPNRDRHVTYTNPHRWLPGFRPAEGDAALRTLVARYLYAYGPATPRHFAQWLNVPPRDAADLFDEAGRLTWSRSSSKAPPGWVVAGDSETPPEPHRGIRLLPYFDAFVVASQPRELLYPGAAAGRALSPSGQAGNYPGAAGRRGGRRGVAPAALGSEGSPSPSSRSGDLTAAQRRQLDEEVELLGAVMEAEPTLTIGTVTVGPHA